MPKVTLLSRPGTNIILAHGVAQYIFNGGEPKDDVPVAVAMACERKKTVKGKPMFKVENLPDVVSHACVVDTTLKSVKQNVVMARQSIVFTQPKLMGREVCL